jgi:DNA-binding NtrC family response regulator
MRTIANRTILLVEPDRQAREQLRAILEGDGYSVIATSLADEALAIIDNASIALVVTELYLSNRKSRCLVYAVDRHPTGEPRCWRTRSTVAQRIGHGRLPRARTRMF